MFSVQHPTITVDFEDSGRPISIPHDVATCLYRVAQEGLQNIAKHSRAEHVFVRLDLRKSAIMFTIDDNGEGFDRKAVKGRGGLGLISMEERVRLVMGTLTITSQLGHGSQLAINVPLTVDNS